MKRLPIIFLASLLAAASLSAQTKTINISTDKTDLVLQVADDGRLFQMEEDPLFGF